MVICKNVYAGLLYDSGFFILLSFFIHMAINWSSADFEAVIQMMEKANDNQDSELIQIEMSPQIVCHHIPHHT